MRGIQKRFPGVHALRGVDFDLRPGETHGLIGENGAGKSTLMKILTGAYAPDEGSIEVFDRAIPAGDPIGAHRAGIAAIYQDANIVPMLSPVANVFLGQTLSRGGLLDERRMRRRFTDLASRLGRDVPAAGVAGMLSPGMQQTLEIMRALERDARVVIMDEPTAALNAAEREALFDAIELLEREGRTIVFILDHLDEVLTLCDRVTVLRDGERVLTRDADATTIEELIEAMLGRRLEFALSVAETVRRETAPSATARQTVLRVESLHVPGILQDVHLSVRRGEIVGVAGLVGSGRTTLLRALAGAELPESGVMEVSGRATRWPLTPRHALRLGIALAPEDRRAQGLVQTLSAAENIIGASFRDCSIAGIVFRRGVRYRAAELAERVNFDRDRLDAPVGTLSGGNQQKILLARALRSSPAVLLVDEPVRGVDVGAKAEIFNLLRRLLRTEWQSS